MTLEDCERCSHLKVDHDDDGRCCIPSCRCSEARPSATFHIANEPGVGPGFIKADTSKPRADLLPPRAVLAVARVLTFGAKKYAPDNWRKVDDLGRYTAAALRHVFAYLGGERNDSESGLHHLAHAACCLLFVVDLEEEKDGAK